MHREDGPDRTESEASGLSGTGRGHADAKNARTGSGQPVGLRSLFSRFDVWRRGSYLTLRAKVVLVVTFIGAALILLAAVFTSFNFRHNVNLEARAHVNIALGVLDQAIVRTQSFGALAPVLDAVSGSPAVTAVAIGTRRGEVLAYEGHQPINQQMLGERFAEAGRNFDNGRTSSIEAVGSVRNGIQDYAVPIVLPGGGASGIAIFSIDVNLIEQSQIASAMSTMSWLFVLIIV